MTLKTNKQIRVNETPIVNKKTQIAFFNSFEEEAEYVAKQRAETSYEKRLTDMEQLRKS